MALTDKLTAIGDAIRAKEGSTGLIPLEDMPTRIASIQTGVDTSDATATATSIASGKTAYVNGQKVTGTMTVGSWYSGNYEPESTFGSNGDLFLVVK